LRPRFLILLPIVRPPKLLDFAVRSVMRQSVQDFELHIISDGAPFSTRRAIRRYSRRDPRIFAHLFAKGERNGEAYRDPIIRASGADYVCQIGDDDLWFPNHLAEIEGLLATCDFGHTIQTEAAPGFKLFPRPESLGDAETVRRMLEERFNFFGPTACGYRREAYLRLGRGWEPAPQDVYSDLFMWRKFLSHPQIAYRTLARCTSLHMGTPNHLEMSLRQRARINKGWWDVVSDSARLETLTRGLDARRTTGYKAREWMAFAPGL
jgi:glycosyltransferase involved in cell wall biosynthesis